MSAVFDPVTGEVLHADPGSTPARKEHADSPEVEPDPRVAALERVIEGLKVDVAGREQEIRNQGRKIKALQDELREVRQEAPEGQLARAIYDAWVHGTGRNPKRTKFGEARQKKVIARIREHHDGERMIRAAKIGVKGASTSDQATERLALIRVMEQAVGMLPVDQATALRASFREAMKDVVVYDDLELIFRDEVHLERFMDFADRFDPPVSAG